MKMYVIKRTKDDYYYSTEIDTCWYYDASEMSATSVFRQLKDVIDKKTGHYMDLEEVSHINLYSKDNAQKVVLKLLEYTDDEYEIVKLGEL